METRQEVHSDLPIPPGEYLEEVIVELGMTKDELARRMNRPAAKLSAIFTGDKAITPGTALQLEKVVGVPAHIWTGLEAEFRLTLARQQEALEQKRLSAESRLVTKFCYADLAKLGFVAKKTKSAEKVSELQHFFGVTSLRNLSTLRRYQAAFRCGKGRQRKRSPEALAAWLRIGELEAQRTTCASFSKSALHAALPSLRAMTRKPPEQFEKDLRTVLADCGVVLVLLPHLPKTYAHGATFWLGRDKAVLMLTIRGAWADVFWFSLFHEAGHILLHNKQIVFLEGDISQPEYEKQEREADRFAANMLILEDEYKEFVETSSFYSKDLQRFAERIGIDPGIVVGRLQHDGYIENNWHNRLRTRYEWKHKEA